MADNENERLTDELVDEEEYKKALEVVNNPKKAKKKKHKKAAPATEVEAAEISDDEAAEAAEAVEEAGENAVAGTSDAEDVAGSAEDKTAEESDSGTPAESESEETDPEETTSEEKTEEAPKPKKKKSTSSNGKKKKKKRKKKKFDPVIPLCLFLAVAAIVGATLYFVLPKYMKKNIGLTVDDLRVRYEQTSEFTTYMSGYNFNIPYDVTYTPAAVSHVNNFEATIRNSAVSHLTSIMGTCRSVDGKIMKLRVLASYSNADDYFDFLMIYYASYLHVLYPEYDEATVRNMVATSLANVGGAETDFIVTGDYGYRTIYENRELGTYVVFEIENADALLPAEIMR